MYSFREETPRVVGSGGILWGGGNKFLLYCPDLCKSDVLRRIKKALLGLPDL
jgi:hypothetical protein